MAKRNQPEETQSQLEIVCLCGSMKFSEEMDREAVRLTMRDAIVLAPNVNLKRSKDLFEEQVPCDSCKGVQGLVVICTKCNHTGRMPKVNDKRMTEIKTKLDALHLRKIEMAGHVRVINKQQYIGESTMNELMHAIKLGKRISFFEAPGVETCMLLKENGFERSTDTANQIDVDDGVVYYHTDSDDQ